MADILFGKGYDKEIFFFSLQQNQEVNPINIVPSTERQENLYLWPLEWGIMIRLCTSQLLLVVTVVLMTGSIHARSSLKVIRKFQDIPSNYVYARQALWFSMKDFNKNSNDKYTFKVVKILKVQEQVSDDLFLSLASMFKFTAGYNLHKWLLILGIKVIVRWPLGKMCSFYFSSFGNEIN